MLVALVPVVAGFFLYPEPPPQVVDAPHHRAGGCRPRARSDRGIPVADGPGVWLGLPAPGGGAVGLSPAAGITTQSRVRVALRLTGAALGVLALIVAAGLPALFPVFRLAQPTGPHVVGFTRFALLDSTRPESFSADPTDKRALVVEAWYPAESPRPVRAAPPSGARA